MSIVHEEEEIYDELNVVPLLDIAFVLIIIFVILATATIAGLRLDLPQASNRETLDATQTRAISVLANGEIYLDGAPVSLGELEAELRIAFAADPLTPIVVRGDGQTAYAHVVAVLDTAKGVGISRVGLPTNPPPTGAGVER